MTASTAAPARFRQGAGRLCLDFVRTLRYRDTPAVTEELDEPAALSAWVAQCGPCGGVNGLGIGGGSGAADGNEAACGSEVERGSGAAGRYGAGGGHQTDRGPEAAGGAELLREARALREAVYVLVLAALDPGGPGALPTETRELLNSAAAQSPPVPRLLASGELGWYAADPVRATLSLVARDALDLATSPALLPRVRHCASPTCGALFLDHSRPGARRWCSMDICGNRAKKAGLRARA